MRESHEETQRCKNVGWETGVVVSHRRFMRAHDLQEIIILIENTMDEIILEDGK